MSEETEAPQGRGDGYVLPRWFTWLAGLLMVSGSPWAAWITVQAFEVKQSLAVVEASRFSAKDGQEVWKEIAAIRQSIAVLPTQTRLDKFEERQQEILQRMVVLEALLKGKKE